MPVLLRCCFPSKNESVSHYAEKRSIRNRIRLTRANKDGRIQFKMPLTDLDLHHPPYNSFATIQAFYLCSLLTQALLRVLLFRLLLYSEWRCSLGTIIRRVVQSPVLLRRPSRIESTNCADTHISYRRKCARPVASGRRDGTEL